jgi:regulatory protein
VTRWRTATRRRARRLAERSQDPIELATRSLQHYDRTRSELDERLAKAGVGEAERAEALDRLEQVGYVDDGRFATARAELLAGRGQGDGAIRFDLRGRGIDTEAIDAAIAALEPESERASRLADQLGRTAKTAARLQRKGFGGDALAAAFGDSVAGGSG